MAYITVRHISSARVLWSFTTYIPLKDSAARGHAGCSLIAISMTGTCRAAIDTHPNSVGCNYTTCTALKCDMHDQCAT